MSTGTKHRHETDAVVAKERPELLIFCGIVGIVGNLMPLVTISVATVMTQHDFIADTVSDLARGDHKWIMDVGFYFHAAGLLALAIAAAHAHLGKVWWTIGIFDLAFTALIVVLLGLWDEFGRQTDGMSVHTSLTFFLGPLFLIGPLAMAKGAGGISRHYPALFIASAVLWIVFAAAFKLVGTGIDGILEKIGIAGSMLWTVPLAFLFLARGWESSDRLYESDPNAA